MQKIQVITYNLNNNKMAYEDLLDYINTLTFDIVLISIQEYFYTINLPKNYPYVYYNRMYGIHALILSKIQLDVKFYVYCFGECYLGNKGCIISNINSSLIFISLHLKDGENNLALRNKQINYITHLILKIGGPVILAGDFNYRFTKQIFKYCKDFDELDAIKRQYGCLENEICFKFTYKYNENVLNNTRMPSYCDRILYKNIKSSNVTNYNIINQFSNSDHKLVYMSFNEDINNLNIFNVKLTACKSSIVSCFLYDNLLCISFTFITLTLILYIFLWKK